MLFRSGNELLQAQTADWFTSQMNELTKYERAIKALDMPPAEKRKQLDMIKQLKIQTANTVRDAVDKTTLPGLLL